MRPNPTSRLLAVYTLNTFESRWFIFLNAFPDGKVQITKELSYLYFEAAQSDG
jgi:hypothetical protein